MATVSIRAAEPGDLPALADVYRRASLSNEDDRASLLAQPDALVFHEGSVEEGRTRVAVEGERVVGFATTRALGTVAELDDLFVDPDRMRRGIGRLLIADAVAVARAQGVVRIAVTANPHALDFYRAAGFVPNGTTATTPFGPAHRMHLDVAPDGDHA